MATTLPTPNEAAHVLFHAGLDGGYPPSGFPAALLNLFGVADAINAGHLALGFPGYAAAIQMVRDGNIAKLHRIASDETTDKD